MYLVVGPMVYDATVPLSFLKASQDSFSSKAKFARLCAEVLKSVSALEVGTSFHHFETSVEYAMHKQLLHVFKNKERAADIWAKSGLSWSQFLDSDDNVKEFLTKHVSQEFN